MKTVIEMAKEAGWEQSSYKDDCPDCSRFDIERFAALVREDERKEQALKRLSDIHQEMEQKDIDCPCGSQCIKCSASVLAAVLAEREACAKVCEELEPKFHALTRDRYAAAIRARSE